MIEIHCSALPRILKCSASLVRPDIVIGGDNEAARVGSAVHEALAESVKAGYPDLQALAAKHRIDKAQLAALFWAGKRLWEELAPALSVIGTEVEMRAALTPEIGIIGSADVVAHAVREPRPTLAILDWKSGVEGDFDAQLLGYAVMAAQQWPSQNLKAIIIWLATETIEVRDLDPEAARSDLTKRLTDAVAHPERFSPDYDSCAFCPRAIDCPGRQALVRQSVTALTEVQDQIGQLTPAALARLYPKVKLIQRVCDLYEATLRNAVALAPDGLPTGDGKVLILSEQDRSTILARQAWDALTEAVGDKLLDCVTINKGAVAEVIKDEAPQGLKGGAVKKFFEHLDRLGALDKKTVRVMRAIKEG